MKRVKQDRRENRPRKRSSPMKAVLGIGALCAVIHVVCAWLEFFHEQEPDLEDHAD